MRPQVKGLAAARLVLAKYRNLIECFGCRPTSSPSHRLQRDNFYRRLKAYFLP